DKRKGKRAAPAGHDRAAPVRTSSPRDGGFDGGQKQDAGHKQAALPETSPRPLVRRQGALPAEILPLILEVEPGADYALIDSGAGRKLERYGPYLIERPEGQAIWQAALQPSEWARADAVFTGDTDEEGMGRWRFPHEPLGETWPM